MTQAQALHHSWPVVNGIRLHCVSAGQGPLVMLLHGFPECWVSWRHQIPALARHWRVVAPDLRGYNLSDKPAGRQAYAITTLIEDVRQLIEVHGAEQATIIGHDWGGVIAWSLALAHPEHVARLVIINAPHPRIFIQQLLTNARQRLRSSYAFFFQLPYLPEVVLRVGDGRLLERMIRGTSTVPEAFSPEVMAAYRHALGQPGARTAALNYYRAAARYGLRFWLNLDPVIRQPTLLIWGQRDVALDQELNKDLERYVPHLQRLVLPAASHWIHEEFPALINRSILAFLEQGQRCGA
ncbi:alpha/beta fold hydrolase [Kallotenue papyrolyticum]|uniref:alpha/beta fold hydrolase n=1 Tax=Kallotenue papyrolyticum TaxID=1325125 RepID=UPI00047859E9|nr:alpha/beta hydrolase [Kallotenue papyrolyticum]